MTDTTKWTVRNVDPEAYELLLEVKENTGLGFGHLLGLAVNHWYQELPEQNDLESPDNWIG